jgi:hypothetical protein
MRFVTGVPTTSRYGTRGQRAVTTRIKPGIVGKHPPGRGLRRLGGKDGVQSGNCPSAPL